MQLKSKKEFLDVDSENPATIARQGKLVVYVLFERNPIL
jgi:hypothetical protein